MRALIAALVIASVLRATTVSAKPDEIGDADSVAYTDQRSGRQDAAAVPPGGKELPTKPPKRIVKRAEGDRPPTPTLVWRADVGPCVTGGGTILMTDPLMLVPEPYNACPTAPAGGGAARPPRPSPLEAAYEAWYWETTLPSPTLATSPPTGAVTGLDLYLSIGGPQTLTFDVPALGYRVHLEVTSVYDIDWGDPAPDNTQTGRAVTKGHRTQGGAWPNGDLRHQYIERGSATIEVTQRWTASWSAAGESGTIADRLGTSGTITIPVQEIQAVLVP